MSYWTETDDYLRDNGGSPTCPNCGKEMFPADDHGRFMCLCGYGHDVVTGSPTRTSPNIPQMDVTGMTDKEKAKIPPLNRLHSAPTAAEAKLFALLAKGPDIMDDPAYRAALKALDEERK